MSSPEENGSRKTNKQKGSRLRDSTDTRRIDSYCQDSSLGWGWERRRVRDANYANYVRIIIFEGKFNNPVSGIESIRWSEFS